MVIKLNKLHFFAIALITLTVTFVMALYAERDSIAVSSEPGVRLPIIMYHHISTDNKKCGKYVIALKELEEDLKYIKGKGYKTVTIKDLIDYTEGKTELPEKIVLITFDDGFKSVYKYALPLFEKYEMNAVASAVGIITEQYTQNGDNNINYSYMTWDELSELDKSPFFEVQNHSYNLHRNGTNERKGLSRMNGENVDTYRKVLTEDLTKMQDELLYNSNINAVCAVYPYGVYSSSTLDIIKSLGFRSSLTCEERINKIYEGDRNCLFNLGRFNRPSGLSTKSFMEKAGIN